MRPLTALLGSCILAISMSGARAADGELMLFAAGSLKSAMNDGAAAFEEDKGRKVGTAFGASGLMRQRIEDGETAHVFASANMAHPQTLHEAGKAGPVRMFARNRLCAIAQPEVEVTTDTLLETMLDPDVRDGTSTPKADPSGDYAFELFAKTEGIEPGARQELEQKSLQLTGGPDSPKPPQGRNTYGWVMSEKQADIFLTYCTNARLAQSEVDGLQIVQIPEELAVGADYGITVVEGAPASADELVDFILSPKAQEILRSYGFSPPAS